MALPKVFPLATGWDVTAAIITKESNSTNVCVCTPNNLPLLKSVLAKHLDAAFTRLTIPASLVLRLSVRPGSRRFTIWTNTKRKIAGNLSFKNIFNPRM
jgi:hypothetical protein